MTESKTMIDLQHITMKYGDLTVLDDISLQIAEGSKTVIIGPSGAGKSTLLRCINLFEKPYSGSVKVNNQILTNQKNKVLYKARQDIGMVFQSFNLYAHKTVLEHLTFAPIHLKHEPKEEVTQRAMENLEKVGLALKKNAYPSQLSGGQQQRVAIARALASGSKVLFADEPTGNLDEENTQIIMGILENLAHEKGICVVVVTHNRDIAERADRVYRITEGMLEEA